MTPRILLQFGRAPRWAMPEMSDVDEWHDPESANVFCDWGLEDFDE